MLNVHVAKQVRDLSEHRSWLPHVLSKPDANKEDCNGLSRVSVQAGQQKPFETVPCCSPKAAARVIKRCKKSSIPLKNSLYTLTVLHNVSRLKK